VAMFTLENQLLNYAQPVPMSKNTSKYSKRLIKQEKTPIKESF
jgi:hypothetical protein